MGHKVNPTGIRLGVIKEHNSVWYADKKEYSKNLLNDIQVREFLDKRLVKASVSKIVIERPAQNARITIHTARPGIVIGKKGEDVDRLRREVSDMMGVPVHINIEEVRKPGPRCPPGSAKRCRPAGASCDVPSRYEACGTERHAPGCQGYQDPGRRSSRGC